VNYPTVAGDPTLPAWRNDGRCAINSRMIVSLHRYYFWFYGYPMPQAEDGSRSV
jgi:hypothetical protein